MMKISLLIYDYLRVERIAIDCCTQYASKFGKLSSGHRTGKGPFLSQSLRKAIPKNAQTTTQLRSSHTLVMFKILQARLQQYVNRELPDVQAGFRKGRGTRDQIANIHGIIKKAIEFQKNIYFCFIDYSKAFDYVDHNKLWKILKEKQYVKAVYCHPAYLTYMQKCRAGRSTS